MPINSYLRSFSFRAGFIIFLMVTGLLMAQRILIYQQTIDTAYEDTQLIMDAHEEEMDDAVERHGVAYLEDVLRSMSEKMRDKHIYLLLNHSGKLTGNLKTWPNLDFSGKEYAETKIAQANNPPLHLLVSISEYKNGDALLIGYDLERVDALRHDFIEIIMYNLLLSFAISLIISAFIVWLLARHFRKFNLACEQVMSGNIEHRINVHGTRDEFDKLASNINRMLEWIKSLLETFKDSSNAIAHDMRTPISRLRLELRALSERPKLDTETRANIAAQVERLDEMIAMFENILSIAKAQSRSTMELFAPVDIGQITRDITDFYLPVIEEKKLQLNLNIPETPIIIKGDKQLLGQAVMNLIDNACKYTDKNGKIDISLKRDNDNVILTIADNGTGIPEELREKAKERFFRLDASRHTSGHGLGLSLVTAVAGLHQGSLILTDNNQGLKAIFTLKV